LDTFLAVITSHSNLERSVMPAALRPYVTAGVALVGASVISVTPIAPSQPDIRVANPAVRLAAASIANIPANLINAILSIPMAEIQGIQRYADAMEASGSWWVYTPTNVLGWDPANPEMTKGLVDALLPFPALSGPLGTHLNWWLAANLPMHEGCTGFPPCPDPIGMLSSMFTVGPWEFYDADGYTFPEIINPISEHEGEVGQELGEEGEPVEWSGQTVKLDPLEPVTSVMNYLMADPSEVTYPTFEQAVTAVTSLLRAYWITWYPFVPQSYIWDPQYQLLAPLFRAFAPILCPDCNPEDPSLPPVTSTPTTSSESGETFTLDVEAQRVSGSEVQPGEDLGTAMGFADAQQDIQAGAATVSQQDIQAGAATVSQQDIQAGAATVPEALSNPAGVLDTVSKTVAPEAGLGLDTPSAAVDNLTPTQVLDPPSSVPEVPLINVTRDSLKAEPGQSGGQHRMPGGGLAGAVKSVGDQVSSAISRISDGLRGGGAETGESSPGEAGTGDTSE
jgi:hypothetical protein